MTTCAALSGGDRTSEVVEVHTFCTAGGVEVLCTLDTVFLLSTLASSIKIMLKIMNITVKKEKKLFLEPQFQTFFLQRLVDEERPASCSSVWFFLVTTGFFSPSTFFTASLLHSSSPQLLSDSAGASSIFLLHRDLAAVSECVCVCV